MGHDLLSFLHLLALFLYSLYIFFCFSGFLLHVPLLCNHAWRFALSYPEFLALLAIG